MSTAEQAARPREVEPETAVHWWCRRCGIWKVVDAETDHCRDCAYMRGPARRGRRRPR